jgi:hypothetical protein
MLRLDPLWRSLDAKCQCFGIRLRFSLLFAIGTASIRRGKEHDPVRNPVYRNLSTLQGTYASSASKTFRHSGMTVAFKTTFEVFTRVGPDNSLERLTESSVGLVTDRPSDVYELLVTLL